MTEQEQPLWTAAVERSAYDGPGEKYQAAILEQYKIYVEMADRLSARRALANTFFLTLNTAVFTVIGVFWTTRPGAAVTWLALPFAALMLQCGAWFWLLRAYRALNRVKYRVIGQFEERLPASPFWRAEWDSGQRRDTLLRTAALSGVEQVLPIFFALLYAAGVLTALLS
ncbi:RipA family octameric membrane protein [Actinoplanes sp. CA-252034]|uniref:RipA family octameric membrane protein n=1 Tax=Actinoplanes sp. CA-252034 TaxID=3239906 RepID=UPI003D964E8A